MCHRSSIPVSHCPSVLVSPCPSVAGSLCPSQLGGTVKRTKVDGKTHNFGTDTHTQRFIWRWCPPKNYRITIWQTRFCLRKINFHQWTSFIKDCLLLKLKEKHDFFIRVECWLVCWPLAQKRWMRSISKRDEQHHHQVSIIVSPTLPLHPPIFYPTSFSASRALLISSRTREERVGNTVKNLQ